MWKFACLLLVVAVVAAAEEQDAIDQDAYQAGLRLAKIHEENPDLFNTMIGRLQTAQKATAQKRELTTPLLDLMSKPWVKSVMEMMSKVAKAFDKDGKERDERFISSLSGMFGATTPKPDSANPFSGIIDMMTKWFSSMTAGKKREVREALMEMLESASQVGKEREVRFLSSLPGLSGLLSKPTTTTTPKPDSANPLSGIMDMISKWISSMTAGKREVRQLPGGNDMWSMIQLFMKDPAMAWKLIQAMMGINSTSLVGKKREVREASPFVSKWKNRNNWSGTGGRRNRINNRLGNIRDRTTGLRKNLPLTNDGDDSDVSAGSSLNRMNNGMSNIKEKTGNMLNKVMKQAHENRVG